MIILCADDYALTQGVSRGIGELAAAQLLSATSILTTSPHWPETADMLRPHRVQLSIGLHFNLTLGAPLGAMPRLAPDGKLPSLGRLLGLSLLGQLSPQEIAAEIERQLDSFERGLGFPPDHIDGHQHVHVLPGVRGALLDIVARRYASAPPLLRDPTARGPAGADLKALTVALLATGFAADARKRGLPTNDSFAGFSDFDLDRPYAEELKRVRTGVGLRHIFMCHPGHPDAELATLDSVVARRGAEYDALTQSALADVIWRPSRNADGPSIAWPLSP